MDREIRYLSQTVLPLGASVVFISLFVDDLRKSVRHVQESGTAGLAGLGMAGLGAAGLGALGVAPWLLPAAIIVSGVLSFTSTIIQTKAAKRISREQIQAQQEALRQQLLMMQMQQEQQQQQQEMWMKMLPIAVIALIAFALLQPRR